MDKVYQRLHKRLGILVLISMVMSTVLTAGHLYAAPLEPPAPPVQVHASAGGLAITWPNPTVTYASAANALGQLPVQRYQGYELPMQLITVAWDDGLPQAAIADLLQIQTISASAWTGALEPAAPLQPPVLDSEIALDKPLIPEVVALPAAPIFLLRQGTLHGQPIAVLAVSPLYRADDGVKLATSLAIEVTGAHVVDQATLRAATSELATAARTGTSVPTDLAPTNGDALRAGVKLTVSAAGIQEVTGQALAGAGVNLSTIDPAQLQLKYNGTEVPLQLAGLVNGQLAPTSTLRFYTPTVGDRWNVNSSYWLTTQNAAGARMATRDVTPAGAPVRTNVFERGVWEANQLYESRYAGFDGDNWYNQKLIDNEGVDASNLESVTVPVSGGLPLVSGTATYSVAVTTNIRGDHTLRIQAGSSNQDISWNSVVASNFTQNWQPTLTSTVSSATINVALFSTAASDLQRDAAVLLDKVFWTQPVALNLGAQGARFTGVAGDWHYTWSNPPANFQLYDVTDPAAPVLLSGADGSGFQDGPTAHDYLLAGPGTVNTPTLAAYSAQQWSTSGAEAIYIAPQSFIAPLAPLLQLRRDQGYSATTVDVQTIYDAWSFGHVSAAAIRAFLRYADASWTVKPRSVVLVGDGTWDPKNYEAKNNTNWIPPYLAVVDPWLGEAACENCFVQLDGADPLTGDDPNGHFFAAELWIGRLPVKSTAEVTTMVNKLIRYETSQGIGLWQGRTVSIADNYVRTVDSTGTIIRDLAGDFAAYADGIIELAPPAVKNARIYYDPYPQLNDPQGTEPWRMNSAQQAFNAVVDALSAGAALVTYNGHSHQWQWAVTDETPNASPDYLFGLYDADILSNQDRYFINLSMTCLTSQFQKPALSGTTVDERLLLNPTGGAIAVWGPAGLSVAFGHDLLQRGFHEHLWAAPPLSATLGELLEAGYTKLVTESACCQDTAKTFLLLGDPLTKARAWPDALTGIYLPLINR